MSDYEFNVPFPPSVNGYWRTFRNRQIISKRGREYRLKIREVMQSHGLDKEMLPWRLSVRLILEPPTIRKYDIDNFCKAIFDGLTHCEFWEDDEQVDRLLIKKSGKLKGGNVKVKVTICK